MLDHATCLIVLDAYTPHVYLSFDIYYVFNYDTCKLSVHILRMVTRAHPLFRPAESVHVAFKTAVSTEHRSIATSVTDRSRPYPECLCCYCIHIVLTEPYYSCQENTKHGRSRHNTWQLENGCLMSRHELVKCTTMAAARW